MRYARVANNQIVEGPTNLPTGWRNISNFHLQSNTELKVHGWLPVIEVGRYDGFNANTEIKEGPSITINPDDVTATWTVRPMTQPELDQREVELDEVRSQEIKAAYGKVLFKVVNEIRVLKNQTELTPEEFKTWWKNNT